MDTLNDYYLDYFNNYEEPDYNYQQEILDKLPTKCQLNFDEWSCVYSDELWHLYNTIKDITEYNQIFDVLDYSSFCSMAYDNSSKYI